MEYLLFVIYLVLFAWLLTRVKFFTQSGLTHSQLIIVFLLKVMAGIFYGWMGIYYGNRAQMLDTWAYHHMGIEEYELLLSDPKTFFFNIFHDPYPESDSNFFGSSNSYWNDLRGNIFIKMLALFDLFTFKHYYVNVIFYSFITLFGPISIFKVMNDVFPGRRMLVLLASFLVPSFIYWTSGIHREGLLFVGISLVIYHLYFGWKENKLGIKRWAGIFFGLLLLFIFRNVLVVLFIPAIIAWFLTNRWPRYAFAIFSAVYLFFGILFFTARFLNPKLDFPQAVVDKQQAFLNIRGGLSAIPIKELKPNAVSFITNTPQALTSPALRPYPGDVRHLLSLAASVEINLLVLMFLLFLLFRRNGAISRNVIYLSIFFSISVLLAIGFSVNNLGAIVRYRSIILPLLVIPMVAQTDWRKVLAVFETKNKPNQATIT